MTQTLAIFYDAYRSLSAKVMFWIVLILSVILVGAVGCVGLNETGVKVVVWQFDHPLMNSVEWEPAVFYKWIFVEFGVGLWLAWFATILALISTAGIFPDLVNSGSIHLLVSKPVGRLRLFLTQYAAGLLFVTLQVTLFTLVCFLVIGLRGGAWEPGVFVAVPLVVCFFSYLFCVCVLLGLVTRSTLAALLLTLVFWPLTAGVGITENWLLLLRKQQEHSNSAPNAVRVHPRDNRGAFGQLAENGPPADAPTDKDASALKRGGKVPRAIGRALLKAVAEPSTPEEKPSTPDENKDAKATKATLPRANTSNSKGSRADAEEGDGASAKLKRWYNVFFALKTILPKTSETIGLLERSAYEMADLPKEFMGPPQQANATRETAETIRGRSVWWVVGTSLGFEAVVLCLAALVFCRRDY